MSVLTLFTLSAIIFQFLFLFFVFFMTTFPKVTFRLVSGEPGEKRSTIVSFLTSKLLLLIKILTGKTNQKLKLQQRPKGTRDISLWDSVGERWDETPWRAISLPSLLFPLNKYPHCVFAKLWCYLRGWLRGDTF